ncbi:MAG TPA: UDP-3-O-(3-hydroxymyristoyl)glucosamine N-acyltransferase, partial [Chitinophagaceae bacterium]|nr:UDP-3-O-(3-hydroxymyristoyl)glucosamine N-acyltransferase [Chitinophagaceae bacterium]
LIMVAHNAEIGEHTVIAAQAGISGSTKIGEHCQIGGQAGFAGHLTIAARSRINAQSGFGKSIDEPGKAWSGSPAREFQQHYRMLASMETLPAMQREIAAIKEILSLLQSGKKDA